MGARSANVKVSILGNASDLLRATREGEAGLKKFAVEAEATEAKTSGFGKGIVKGAGLATAGITALYGAFNVLKESIDTTEELGQSTIKLSRITGLDAKTSSEWAAQAKVRGIETQKLITSFTTLDKQIVAGGSGTKASIAAFKALGISQDELKKGNFSQVIGDVSDALHKLPDGANKAAYAQKLFGKQAQTLMPLLEGGKKAMTDQLNEAGKYGATLSGKTVKQMKEAAGEQRKFSLAMLGLKVTIGTAVLPILDKFIKTFVQVIDGIRTGKGKFGELKDDVHAVGVAFSIAFKAIEVAVQTFIGTVKIFVGLVKGMVGPVSSAAKQIAHFIVSVIGGAWSTLKGIVSSVVQFFKSRVADMLGLFQSILEAAGHMPIIGGKFRKAADGIQQMRDKLYGTNEEARKTVGLFTQIATTAGNAASKMRDSFQSRPGVTGHAVGGRIPGARVAADSYPAMLSPGEFVVTGDGERRLEQMTFPGVLNWLGGAQLPHFASGGRADYTVKGFNAGYNGSGFGALLDRIVKSGDPGKDKGGKQGNTPENRRRGTSGNGSFAAMMSAAQGIASRRFNYEWGGGHNASFAPTHGVGHGSGPGVGYDCSGSVSAVLHAGGLLSSPMTSGSFMGYGLPGAGKQVSLFTDADHIIMRLGSHYFGTSSQFNPGGGAGFIPVNTMAGRGVVRHPQGFRAGGRVGEIIKQLGSAKRSDIAKLLNELRNAPVGSFNDLIAAQKAVYDQEQMNGAHPSKARGKALKAAMAIFQAKAGRRIGSKVNYQGIVDNFSGQEELSAAYRLTHGIKAGTSLDDIGKVVEQRNQVAVLKAKRREIVKALKKARKTGDRKLIAKVKAQLKGIDNELLLQRADVLNAEGDYTNDAASEAAANAPTFSLFSGDDATAFTQAQKDLALASLTPDSADDLDALYREQALLSKRIPSLRTDPLATADDVSSAVQQLQGVNEQIANFTGNSQAETQARTDQATARSAVASRTSALSGQINSVFGSTGDLGSGNIIINTLHPGDSSTLTAIAQASNKGNSLSGLRSSPRLMTGL